MQVPLQEVQENYESEFLPVHKKNIAEHYGIFQDLFDGDFFYPTTHVDIVYNHEAEYVIPVYNGNYIFPMQAIEKPYVQWDSDENTMYTLIMTNPDGHPINDQGEYIHWAVANIKGDDMESGQELAQYVQPFPCKGIGFQRIVFLLFKQKKQLELPELAKGESKTFANRSFSTPDFFENRIENLIPVGVQFFQCEWDESVSDFFHEVLDTKEPAFEYQHPPPYHPPQIHYPRREPFNRYFDRYRDKKELHEEVLKMKLSMTSPYQKEYKDQLKYPTADRPKPGQATWITDRNMVRDRRLEQYHILKK